MKNKYKKLLIFTLLLVPTIVFASNGTDILPVSVAIGMEAFVSIHMSIFVLKPLAEIISPEKTKETFWKLFIIRAVILLFFDLFITTMIAIIDFFGVFIGAMIVLPIASFVTKKNLNNQVSSTELKCAKCNTILKVTDKVCPKCGEPFTVGSAGVADLASAAKIDEKVIVTRANFDPIYSLSEDKLVEEFLNKELQKAGVDKSTKLIPNDILKRKKILNIIFSILVFIYIILIFFHFPIYTYIIGIIILVIFFRVTRKYNFMVYLKKQLKARPGEKISNIVMNAKNTLATDNTKSLFLISLIISVVLPLIIFYKPRIIYEKVDGGYAVRYYIFGLTNYKTANIPETHNNEPVLVLRGNTFSNMPFLESVTLPDSITTIRGQAFKNCKRLTEVNIPKHLEYLGGGAFYNAKSLKRIELPDTLTYLGGESFYNATSLEYVKLSNNLSEIRGDSFEYCTSLRSISIPDNVTRIGGHAFYGDSSLSEVVISENSKLKEIGSSAFRQCYSLYNIKLPQGTYVNERAFKESPTTINRYNYNSYDINNNLNYY